MTYDEWIARERRLRIAILEKSPLVKERGTHRVCKECNEVCLCHEEHCPNCNSPNIGEVPLFDLASESRNRFRCRYRFSRLDPISG